jgi:nucleoid DNA-binding protein
MAIRNKPFDDLAQWLASRASLRKKEARELLIDLGVRIRREVMVNKKTIIWWHLGTFDSVTRGERIVKMRTFKALGLVSAACPDVVNVGKRQRLHFRAAQPSRGKHARQA